MGPSNSSYLSTTAIFHFHDYGRKSTASKESKEIFEGKSFHHSSKILPIESSLPAAHIPPTRQRHPYWPQFYLDVPDGL